MKHTLAVLLVAAAASKVQANNCPDVTIPDGGGVIVNANLGHGRLTTSSGSDFTEMTISSACLTERTGVVGQTGVAKTAGGCFWACETDYTDGDTTGGDCSHTAGNSIVAIGWHDDTKTCTCYYDNTLAGTLLPSINLANELSDEPYGCAYGLFANFLLTATCNADQGDVELDVSLTGSFDLDDYNCDTTVDLKTTTKKDIEAALEDVCNPPFTALGTQCTNICEATVTTITVEGCTKETDLFGKLNIEFVAETVVMLADPVDIHIAEEIADDIFTILESTFDTALAGTGVADAIEAEVDTTGVFDGDTTAVLTPKTSDIVSKALGDFGKFFPTWHDGDDNTCHNDGTYPEYMSNQNYFKATLEECCKAYYSWDFTNCMLEGGADPYTYTTYEFYVDYESGTCKQSCPKDTEGMNCGGLHKNWQATYEDAEECCEDRLFWLNAEKCIAESNGVELDLSDLGSDNYYVDWKDFKCVRDCDTSSGNGPDCGGLAEAWDIPFDSKSDCCSGMLGWKDQDECNSE